MNSKKIVSMIGAAVVAASMALSSLPVCAAVTTMPDGGKFDAAYYAATYPDVVAALGTNANALYQHYKTFGAKEGRQPYAAGTSTAATTNVTTSTKLGPTATLTAAQRKLAKEILNDYLSDSEMWWGKGYTTFYSYTGRYGQKASNPQFAIADLNKDGSPELYITSGVDGVSWRSYSLEARDLDPAVDGYNPTLNYYVTDSDTDSTVISFSALSIVTVMSLNYPGTNFNPSKDQVKVSYSSNSTRQMITKAESDAIRASFLPFDQLLQTQPLTKANVNAIK